MVVKNSHSSSDIWFLCHLLKCAPQPNWLCHQSITTRLNIKTLSPKMVMALIICKNLCNSFKMWQFYWKHSNTHAMTSPFFFFWDWNFAQVWKINMKREFFWSLFFLEKKVIWSAKIKVMLWHFPIDFGLVTNF